METDSQKIGASTTFDSPIFHKSPFSRSSALLSALFQTLGKQQKFRATKYLGPETEGKGVKGHEIRNFGWRAAASEANRRAPPPFNLFHSISRATLCASWDKGFCQLLMIRQLTIYLRPDVERVQSGRGAPTVFGGRGAGTPAQRQAPPPPANTEGKAYVGFSVQQVGDPRATPEYVVANVTADSTADQKGLQQGDKIHTIDGKEVRGMHEEAVKQMLIGEAFSMVTIATGAKTAEIERDCAVPEPEAGGPMVGGGPMHMSGGLSLYGSYGGPQPGYQSMAMPMPMQPPYSPPRFLTTPLA